MDDENDLTMRKDNFFEIRSCYQILTSFYISSNFKAAESCKFLKLMEALKDEREKRTMKDETTDTEKET